MTTVTARMCEWCEVEAVEFFQGEATTCELRGCDAAFCGDSWCADMHIGKHEDAGDCERDREGNVTRDDTRRAKG